jgi:NAD(P)-dependent dehydrogenase (short-subunit alcohol dehydrogenase family)
MLLKDKVAIVYGGGGSVGGAVARALAREGAIVHLGGRTQGSLDAVAKEITAKGGTAFAATVDATDTEAVESHLKAVVDSSGPVKLMFNAIGWADTQGELVTDMTFDRFVGCVDTALKTWFVTGTALARHMGQHGGGVIAGITANAAKESYPYTGGFGVACAAVESFLKLLGNENGPSGVRVVWVRSAGSPDAWGVREAFKLRANEQGITLEEFEKQAAKDVPLRHLPALAEVADAAVMMMSDLGRGTTSTFANVTCGAQVD